MNSNIVILDGQNGYGKTTLFDAIEVLVTGKIKHFNPSLQNRKTETLGILANDVNKDIVISAILVSDVSDEIRVEKLCIGLSVCGLYLYHGIGSRRGVYHPDRK